MPVSTPERAHAQDCATTERVRNKAAERWWALERGTLNPFADIVSNLLAEGDPEPRRSARASTRANKPLADDSCQRHVIIHYHPSDLHLGLRTSPAYNGGRHYDVATAAARAKQGLQAVLERARAMKRAGTCVDYILLPAGGDFIHSDNVQGKTTSTAHTMDLDGLPEEHLRAGVDLYVSMVRTVLACGFDVRVEVVPGNHDYYTSVAIGAAAGAVFRNNPRVTFGNAIAPYAYIYYGDCGIVLHHGDGLRNPGPLAENLTAHARAHGQPFRWAYAITGNLHHVRQHETNGILLLQQPSPCAADRYATKGGWNSARPAVNFYVFDLDRGLVETGVVAFD